MAPKEEVVLQGCHLYTIGINGTNGIIFIGWKVLWYRVEVGSPSITYIGHMADSGKVIGMVSSVCSNWMFPGMNVYNCWNVMRARSL